MYQIMKYEIEIVSVGIDGLRTRLNYYSSKFPQTGKYLSMATSWGCHIH